MPARQDEHSLEPHAIGLPAVTAQSAALIAPAAGSVAGLAWLARNRPEAMQWAGMLLADADAEREEALAGSGEVGS